MNTDSVIHVLIASGVLKSSGTALPICLPEFHLIRIEWRIYDHREISDRARGTQILRLFAGEVCKSLPFLHLLFTYGPEVKDLALFAEYVGPQLIMEGSVSDLMKRIRQTEVVKAAVAFQGEVKGGGAIKLKSGKGQKALDRLRKRCPFRT
jgi:hypothetical protein